MPHADRQAVRARIEALRNWKGENDPDAKLMTDLLRDLEEADRRQSANPVNA